MVDNVDAVRAFLDAANAHRHRATLIVAAERTAGRQQAGALIETLARSDVYWYSDTPPQGAQSCFGPAAFALLGGEIGTLVFDAWAGFDPDAFGALTGSLRAGGLLLLLVPPLDDWPAFNDPQNARITVAPFAPDALSGHFLQRLAVMLRDDRDSLLFEDGRLVRCPEPAAIPATPLPEEDLAPCASVDQHAAVEALVRVATGHRRRPVVLTSDRGRGKSAAFGIAAARLIEQGRTRILLTAPRAQAAAAVLRHAGALSPLAADCLHYVPPDELAAASQDADLVLVDEAAAIPAPLLEQLLRRYPRIAFATTVHGYEGTGRGFALRFTHSLDTCTNSWKALTLNTPIRWAAADPLEALVFRLLALDAEPAGPEAFPVPMRPEDLVLQRLDRDALVGDTQTLSELFGLLVQAHYRTRPLDLRHLLDGPNLEVYVLRAGNHVAATALLAREGGFDTHTAEAIRNGTARPHGHLLPETLAAHQGLAEAPVLRGGRVMRVTVHPAFQRRGLGARLVEGMVCRLADGGFDYIGTSFGATPGLLAFWHVLGWSPLRLSVHKGAASGSHSAVFLRPLSAAGGRLCAEARRRFFPQFAHQLSDSLRELDPVLVCGMLRAADCSTLALDKADLRDLDAFANGQRLAEVTIAPLWVLALITLADGRAEARLSAEEIALLVVRVLQKNAWSACVQRRALTGRKQALSILRAAVRKLLD